VQAGRLKAVRVGRALFFKVSDLKALLREPCDQDDPASHSNTHGVYNETSSH
jgi:hypothetical protein